MICDPVSPGCANCYAWELMERRLFPIIRKAYKAAGLADWETRPVWGKTAPRVLTKGFWTQIIASDKAAAKRGERVKSFPSMIDWLDDMPAGIIDQDGKWLDPIAVLADFLDVIRRTPNTDHLLLTKRPENCLGRLGDCIDTERREELSIWLRNWLRGEPPANVWIGCTVENQEYADKRIPELLKIPAVCRFLSVEPMLGEIDLVQAGAIKCEGVVGTNCRGEEVEGDWETGLVDWAIVGGESGAKARGFDIRWARLIVQQCKDASIPVFVKQMGAKPFEEVIYTPSDSQTPERVTHQILFKDKKGGDISESQWPEDLRVREFPSVQLAQ